MVGPPRSLDRSTTEVAIFPPTPSPDTAKRDEFLLRVCPFSAIHFVTAYASSKAMGYFASGERV